MSRFLAASLASGIAVDLHKRHDWPGPPQYQPTRQRHPPRLRATPSAQPFMIVFSAENHRLDPDRFRRHHEKWHDGLRGENRKWVEPARSTPRNIGTKPSGW
jgi:hypothetical protein